MDCRRIRDQLSAYTDGELTLTEAEAVSRHLASCEQCAEEEASLRQIARITSLIPEEEPPLTLHTRIMSSLSYVGALTPPPPPFLERLRMAFGPALCVAVSGVAVALACGILPTPYTPPAPERGSSGTEAPEAGKTPRKPAARRQAETPIRPDWRLPTAWADPAPPREPVRRADTAPDPAGQPGPGPVPAVPAPTGPRLAGKPAPEPRRAPALLPAPLLPAPPVSAPAREARIQPAPTPIAGRPAAEPRSAEPPAPLASTPSSLGSMPGEPIVNSTGSPARSETIAGSGAGDTMRMAGAPAESESSPNEEEGVNALRRLLEERSRTVPQPPQAQPGRERRKQL